MIAFIEFLTIPSGVGAGGKFRLRDWQKQFIRDVYGPVGSDFKRLVRRAILSVGRKNGKTALIAALVLVHLCGPEAEANGEIYSAANERDQAAIVYKFAAQLVRANKALSQRLRLVDSTKTIVDYTTGSFYRAVSAEAGSKHGFNPTFVVYDELAQAKNRELYDVLDTSMGAREQPLFAVISTQSPDPQHILSQLIDDGLRGVDPSIVTHLYAVDDDEPDIWSEEVWKQANPALGDFRLLEDMRIQADRARRMPSFESTFRNLYLNQRISAESPLIPRSEWFACAADADPLLVPGEEIYLGLDLSSTTDLSALAAVSASDGDRLAAWTWKPAELLSDHENRDRAPYRKWAREGWLETPPGRSIDYRYVAQRLAQIDADYQIRGVAFDRWRIDQFIRACSDEGVEVWVDTGADDVLTPHGIRLVPWGQGYKDMGPAIDALETSILERTLRHNANPVLSFCFANAIAIFDPAGNRKLDKSRSRFRIDAAVASAMAMGLKYRDSPALGPSVYEERGIIFL